MAHNLAKINGKVAMAYQGSTPWHNLGTVMPSGLVSVPDAMKAASLDWTVSLHSMFLQDGRIVPKRQAVVRDGDDAEILGTVSDWYEPIQYTDAFSIFQPAVEEFGLTVEAAGALGKGEKAWMLFKLPTTITPVPGDDVNGYGLAVTGHDGKTSFDFRPTPIRVVCQNTLDAATNAINSKASAKGRVFNVQHIGDVKSAVNDARETVKNVIATMAETGETFAAMAKRALEPVEIVTFIEDVFPGDKDGKVTDQQADRRKAVSELLFRGVGAELAMSATNGQPNLWALYNAVTEYFDHVATGSTKSAGRARMLNQSAVFGSGADIKLLALRRAQQLIAA